jgi:KipI family sensor histidine kinase inhibitor
LSEREAELRLVRAAPGAFYVQVDDEPSPELARRLGAWHKDLYEHRIGDIYDVIPAYRSILIEYRPGLSEAHVIEWIERRIPKSGVASDKAPDAALDAVADASPGPHVHEIPVAYGEGADREELEKRLGKSFEAIVEHHARAEYVVAFLGFTAGFPYLLGLPPELHTPRRARPRDRIPTGAGPPWQTADSRIPASVVVVAVAVVTVVRLDQVLTSPDCEGKCDDQVAADGLLRHRFRSFRALDLHQVFNTRNRQAS